MKTSLTPWQRHKAKWSGCTACPLHRRRRSVVLLRGEVPADVLFVGEGPGVSEDRLGQPFKGPAGKLLDRIAARALGGWGWVDAWENVRPWRLAFSNLVACIPLGDDGLKTSDPEPEHVRACAGRLAELVGFVRPRLIVCVGTVAARWVRMLQQTYRVEHVRRVDVVHPSFILQSEPAERAGMADNAAVKIRCAAEELCGAQA